MSAVLITSAGRRVELLNAFRSSAEAIDPAMRILACDLDVEWSAACHMADQAFAVPRANNPDYIPALLDICRRQAVKLLVPTIDTELQALADARDEFAAIGTHVSVGHPDFVRIARDKQETARVLARLGLNTPPSFTPEEVREAPGSVPWPLIAKPNGGSAGRNISVVNDVSQLPDTSGEAFVLQELLKGPEHTINMYFDLGGKARTVIPHRRAQIRAGEVEKGVTERNEALCQAGWRLAEQLPGARGVICFQSILTERGPVVFEINARFGGGYPLAHAAGATFSTWLLQEALGLECEAHDGWTEGMRMMRYDAAVFEES
ncbi:ATP-grasp domain-containing protein [Aurantiacibacter poecillastricola]|uniref:ATP-grasp domain-containing protein n=1 Tax=Aurantiacibacter poecillastricola TaxID=3064385 RepID=UPI00273DA45E|nr:ATP-grasp domain-containing protein [Aurantiacibacter sp. 219JJ12-13]MDP5260000.1 ATP-grasp domain-containing protein [Aurantiacibacter sp. 219JJ12-13]